MHLLTAENCVSGAGHRCTDRSLGQTHALLHAMPEVGAVEEVLQLLVRLLLQRSLSGGSMAQSSRPVQPYYQGVAKQASQV